MKHNRYANIGCFQALGTDYGYVCMYVQLHISTRKFGPNLWERGRASMKTIYNRYLRRGCCYKSAVDPFSPSRISQSFARREISAKSGVVELCCQAIQSTQAKNVSTRVIQPLKISIALIAPTILAGLSILTTVSVAAPPSPWALDPRSIEKRMIFWVPPPPHHAPIS